MIFCFWFHQSFTRVQILLRESRFPEKQAKLPASRYRTFAFLLHSCSLHTLMRFGAALMQRYRRLTPFPRRRFSCTRTLTNDPDAAGGGARQTSPPSRAHTVVQCHDYGQRRFLCTVCIMGLLIAKTTGLQHNHSQRGSAHIHEAAVHISEGKKHSYFQQK